MFHAPITPAQWRQSRNFPDTQSPHNKVAKIRNSHQLCRCQQRKMIHVSNARQYSGWLAAGLPLFDSQKVQCFIYFSRRQSTKSRSGYGKSRVCPKGTLQENFCDFPPEYYDKLGHDHFWSRPFLFIIPNRYRVTHESLCTSAGTGAVNPTHQTL